MLSVLHSDPMTLGTAALIMKRNVSTRRHSHGPIEGEAVTAMWTLLSFHITEPTVKQES